MGFVMRWLATALAVGVAIWLVPGVSVVGASESWVAIALSGLVLALVNVSVKPVMQLLSLPISILTLGVFYLVVNTAMLYLAAWLTAGIFGVGFSIASFGSAFAASIVVSVVSWAVNALVGD